MNKDIKTILNNPEYIAARDLYFERMKNLFDGNPHSFPFYLNGTNSKTETDAYKDPERWVETALEDLSGRAEHIMDEKTFRPLCIEFGLYGVHFIDKILGAEVFRDETVKQWYNKYLPTPVGDLQIPDLEKDPTWQLAQGIARTFLAAEVTLPLFGLPTIASALNIAVNLYGEEILVSLVEEPEKAMHDLEIINELLCTLHRWYLHNIPLQQLQPVISFNRTQPPGFGQICGCTTQLLSPVLYEEYIAPLDDKLLSVYPSGGMIHLCGSHTQHLPVWNRMKSLRAVQVNDRAAADLEKYFKELRDDQILYLNPCPEMPVEKALEITGGQRLVIIGRHPEG